MNVHEMMASSVPIQNQYYGTEIRKCNGRRIKGTAAKENRDEKTEDEKLIYAK